MSRLHFKLLQALVLLFVFPALPAAASSRAPCCRKSPELHELRWRDGSKRVVAFGGKGFEWTDGGAGEGGIRKKGSFFGDTWSFDIASKEWTILAGDADDLRPHSRWKPSSTTFDDATGLIVFGGCKKTAASGVLDDLWVLRPQDPGHAAWTRIYTERPPAKRRGHMVAAIADHLVVIGGKSWSKKDKQAHILVDVWSLPLSVIRTATGPPAALNLDQTLWGKRPSQWRRGQDFPSKARWGTTGIAIRDPSGKEFIACFGGRVRNSHPNPRYTYFNELWLYDFSEDSWKLEHAGGHGAPQPRDHHGATAISGDLFIYGGRASADRKIGAVLGDLWTYSLATNSWRLIAEATEHGPAKRFMPGVAAISHMGVEPAVAIFGGEELPGSTKTTSKNDLWVYAPKEEWQQLSKLNCSAAATKVLQPRARTPTEAEEQQLAAFEASQSPTIFIGLSGLLSLGILVGSVFAFVQQRRSAADAPQLLATEAGESEDAGVAYTPLG